MSENHGIRCSIKRTKDEIEDKTTKRRRVATTADDDDDDDDDDGGGINQLPDDALYCVLRILQWEDLMNAGLVSRRWERLCRRVCSSLRVLDYNWDTVFTVPRAHCSSPLVKSATRSRPFNCPDFEDRFFTCVGQSINIHDANAYISSFKFEFCLGKWSTASTALLDRWISCALNKGATELDLKYCIAKLKYLSLTRCILPEGTVPQMMCLKSLRLVGVNLGAGDLNSFLSGSRNLESIHLENSDLPRTLFIPDSLTRLKSLHIVTLQPSRWRRIVISSPNLHTFSNRGALMISFHKVSCLNKMCVDLFLPTEELMRYLFGQVAGENAMLERLTLSFYADNKQVISMPEKINKFNQLKQLEIYAYMDLGLSVQKILDILDACPLLEKFNLLTVRLEKDKTTVHREYIYKHLKEVLISRISYTRNYLKLATHLLEHSIAPEKMILGRELLDHSRFDLVMLDNRFSSKKADRSRSRSRSRAFYKIFRKKLMAHRKSSVVSFIFLARLDIWLEQFSDVVLIWFIVVCISLCYVSFLKLAASNNCLDVSCVS